MDANIKRSNKASAKIPEEEDVYELTEDNYGWCAVAAAWLTNALINGVSYAFGIIYSMMLEYFQSSRGHTAWVVSIYCACPLILGPIACALIEKHGCRAIGYIGGITAASGVVLASYCSSIWLLCLTYGLVGGIGTALATCSAGVIVPIYFNRFRDLATAVAASGGGVGAAFFCMVTYNLGKEYDWQSAMYIMGCCCSVIPVCALAFKRPEHYFQKQKKMTPKEKKLAQLVYDELSEDQRSRLQDPAQKRNYFDKIREEHKRQKKLNLKSVNIDPEVYNAIDNFENQSDSSQSEENGIRIWNPITGVIPIIVIRPMQSAIPQMEHGAKDEIELSVLQLLKYLLDPTPLAESRYLVFFLSCMFLYFSFNIPSNYMVDYYEHELYDNKQPGFPSAIFNVIIGVCAFFGQLGMGLASDLNVVNIVHLYVMSVAICGATVFGLATVTSPLGMCFICGFFGLFQGGSVALNTFILGYIRDYVGSYGFMFRAIGFAFLLAGLVMYMSPDYRIELLKSSFEDEMEEEEDYKKEVKDKGSV